MASNLIMMKIVITQMSRALMYPVMTDSSQLVIGIHLHSPVILIFRIHKIVIRHSTHNFLIKIL